MGKVPVIQSMNPSEKKGDTYQHICTTGFEAIKLLSRHIYMKTMSRSHKSSRSWKGKEKYHFTSHCPTHMVYRYRNNLFERLEKPRLYEAVDRTATYSSISWVYSYVYIFTHFAFPYY